VILYRYVAKGHCATFTYELERLLTTREVNSGSLLDVVSLEEMERKDTIVFANFSLPEKTRTIKVSQLISNTKFRNTCLDLLQKAHDNVKIKGNKNRTACPSSL
jgi:hypothetical protein